MPAIALGVGAAVAGGGAYLASQKANAAGDVRIRGNSALDLDSQTRFLEFLELGGDPSQLLLGFKKKGKKAAKGNTNAFKLGNSFFTRPDDKTLRALRDKREVQGLADERKSFERLKASPFFESLLGDADGTSAGLAASISQLGAQSLGGAAQGGLNLEDPVVQARVLGPGALQGFLAQRNLSRQAGLAGLQLTRGGGTPFAQGLPRGRSELMNQVFQSEQFRLGSQQFNASTQINALGLQAGIIGGAGSALGGAIAGQDFS